MIIIRIYSKNINLRLSVHIMPTTLRFNYTCLILICVLCVNTAFSKSLSSGDKGSSVHKLQRFKISLETFSLNSNLDSLKGLKFGNKLVLEILLNQYFYIKLTNALFQNQRWGGGFTVGYQHEFLQKLKAHVELGYNYKPAVNHRHKESIAYDVGASYSLFKYFVPSVSLDNFTIHRKAAIKLGFSIPFNTLWSVTTNFTKALYSASDGVVFKLAYKF